jgi:hypothetical protein
MAIVPRKIKPNLAINNKIWSANLQSTFYIYGYTLEASENFENEVLSAGMFKSSYQTNTG